MLKKTTWYVYALWIGFTELVGLISALLTREGTEIYKLFAAKPPLTPPAIVFPIAWSILYALMGFGAARIDLAPASDERSRGLRFYFAQLGFNFFWSILFFNRQAYGFALAWLAVLWVLILWMVYFFRKVDRLTGNLQIPYLLWVSFAAYLNAGVWLLNS